MLNKSTISLYNASFNSEWKIEQKLNIFKNVDLAFFGLREIDWIKVIVAGFLKILLRTLLAQQRDHFTKHHAINNGK